ncbi:DUF421 domain-containing protein [Myceligenerans halotolerans]
MTELLGISPLEAVAVVLATVGMYAALVVLVRLLGQRMLAGLSAFDLAAIIGIGSIMGRAALGEAPRLAGGILALATLAACQLVTSRIRGWGARAITTRPVVLMAGPEIVERNLRRCRVAPHELAGRLRQAGIRNVDEVAIAVLEPSGTISVIRRGEPLSPLLLDGVDGAELVPDTLRAGRST